MYLALAPRYKFDFDSSPSSWIWPLALVLDMDMALVPSLLVCIVNNSTYTFISKQSPYLNSSFKIHSHLEYASLLHSHFWTLSILEVN